MSIKSFNNVEDMFAEIDKANKIADSNTDDFQKEIKPGNFFARNYEGIVIYGEVVESPYEEDQELYKQPHMLNYRLTNCFSVLCPEGELGDTHVSEMHMVLTKEQFEQARKDNWPSNVVYLNVLIAMENKNEKA